MFFYLLLLGIGLTVLLHYCLQEFSRFKQNHPERYQQLLKTGGVLGLLWIVSRIGLGAMTNFMWALAALLPFVKRPQAGQARPRNSRMTREEAAQILGVSPNASREEIHAAWRDQMHRNHPDQGGSEYLASQINQAKDVLLKK